MKHAHSKPETGEPPFCMLQKTYESCTASERLVVAAYFLINSSALFFYIFCFIAVISFSVPFFFFRNIGTKQTLTSADAINKLELTCLLFR